jgi:glutamate racemase
MDKRPIGVFDSGLGGLTVVKEIQKVFPHEDIIYLGDTARVPYGGRSKETLVKFALQDANFLISKNVKCIVIACNTVSAVASGILRSYTTIPVFDVIGPAAEASVETTKTNKVAVIGTNATIKSRSYEKAISKIEKKIKLYSKACPLFVPAIEEGEIKGELINLLIDKYLKKFKNTPIDVLILGCTHYPIIGGVIKQRIDSKIDLIFCGRELAKLLKKEFRLNNLSTDKKRLGKISLYITDYTINFEKIAKLFLGTNSLNISKVTLE